MNRDRARAALLALAIASLVLVPVASSAAPAASCFGAPMEFGPMRYVDTSRAGGEPMIHTHPDGTLLYAAHAGSTHFYTPAAGDATTAAFVQNYEGQVYAWTSDDNGATWTFVPRRVPANVPAQGFSDPDFAIDAAGQVYLSEINLVNVAMSKSTDGGKSYTLQNFGAQTITDRQWSEADQKDVLYLVGNAFVGGTLPTRPVGNLGHYLYRSTDGGKTFTAGRSVPGGLGDLRVDKRNGTLYEANYDGQAGVLGINAFRKARSGDLTPTLHQIADGVAMRSHWPTIDLDKDGNVYIVWDESGEGDRAAGVWYAYSKDAGRTWSAPVRVDRGPQTDIWPWLAVGDPGRVAIAWFEADVSLPGGDAETPGSHGWNIVAAQTISGLGCAGTAGLAPFSISKVSTEPIHTGTVCMGGTVCQAQLIDRRLGDYFAIEIDAEGMLVLAYSDTRQGGAVALPGFARQSGGTSFFADGETVVKGSRQRRPLAETGTGAWMGMGLILVATALGLHRWRARGA